MPLLEKKIPNNEPKEREILEKFIVDNEEKRKTAIRFGVSNTNNTHNLEIYIVGNLVILARLIKSKPLNLQDVKVRLSLNLAALGAEVL